MLCFMFLDVMCALAGGIFAVLPRGCCPSGSDIDGNSSASSTPATCSPIAPIYAPFQVIALAYAVIKAIVAAVLSKLVFQHRIKRTQHRRVKDGWVFCWRLAPSAVLLPPLGLCLVHYVTKVFSHEAKVNQYSQDCIHTALLTWWVVSVLFAGMCLLLVVEAVVFTWFKECYLHGGTPAAKDLATDAALKSSSSIRMKQGSVRMKSITSKSQK